MSPTPEQTDKMTVEERKCPVQCGLIPDNCDGILPEEGDCLFERMTRDEELKTQVTELLKATNDPNWKWEVLAKMYPPKSAVPPAPTELMFTKQQFIEMITAAAQRSEQSVMMDTPISRIPLDFIIRTILTGGV